MAFGTRELYVKGLFYRKKGILGSSEDGVFVPFERMLEPFVGKYVRGLIQHIIDKDKPIGSWGIGSCWWESVGKCPYGHHENPTSVLDWNTKGVLRREGSLWVVEGESREEVPFTGMDGHNCRVVFFSTLERGLSPGPDVGELSGELESMLSMLKFLRSKTQR